MNYQPVETSQKRELHNFLKEQVEENERNKHLSKLRDVQETNKVKKNLNSIEIEIKMKLLVILYLL
jgi:hypothetical protein